MMRVCMTQHSSRSAKGILNPDKKFAFVHCLWSGLNSHAKYLQVLENMVRARHGFKFAKRFLGSVTWARRSNGQVDQINTFAEAFSPPEADET